MNSRVLYPWPVLPRVGPDKEPCGRVRRYQDSSLALTSFHSARAAQNDSLGRNGFGDWHCFLGAGRENMWLTPPPMTDPTMPSTIVQKIVICTCITDFAISPAISPIRTYQTK